MGIIQKRYSYVNIAKTGGKKKMKTKKLLSLVTAVVLVLGLLTGCSDSKGSSGGSDTGAGNDANKVRTIRVGYMTGQPDQYAGYIGTEQGIFEKYGVKIESSEYAAGINTVDAIATGTVDIGLLADYAAVNRIGNTLDAINLVIFSELALVEPNIGGLYVAPQYANDLKSLDGSEGWITQIGTVWEYYNWQSQNFIGIDPESQKVVQTDSKQTSLALAQQGNASAIVAHGADGRRFEEQGWVLAVTSRDMGIKTGSYLITTKEFLAQNTDLLADYLRGLNESIDYITANEEASAVKCEAKFGVLKDDFIIGWNTYNFEIGFTEAGATHLEQVGKWAFDHHKFDKEYDIRKFIDTSAAEKAVPDKVTYKK